MLRDSRHDAADWIATRLKAGDRLEYFGASQKLPKIPAGVTMARATEYHGMHSAHDTSETRAAAIVNEWMERRPTMIIVIPDHSSLWRGAPFDGTMPPTLFSALESNSLPWRQLAWFETPPLFPWIRRPPLDYPMVNPRVSIYGIPTEKD
jgi:hypothetical protein